MSNILDFFTKEKEKTVDLLSKIKVNEEDNNKLAYLIIKLQEINLELKSIIDTIEDKSKTEIQNKYIKNEFMRRNKIHELLPLFTYIYMSYKN